MFKIQDGRKSFTQWDLNRKIIVEDDSITQVHFTNLLNKNALVSEVKNHLADVPNVLLQDYGTILIYGYDGNYTKYVEAFRVVRREKPEDYIYTETEVLNYNNLLERMNNIEGSIQQVVTDYLRENPPKVDLDGYATKEYVDNAIAAISAVDLSDYFTKEEANAKFATKEEIPSTSGLATEEFVNRKVSGLASESFVNDAVAAIPKPDLSGYALKSEIPSTAGLATEQYVNEAVSNVSVDLTGYATETYVNEAVAGIEIPEVDLSGYALKSEIPSTAGLATETYVNDAVAAIEIPVVDLSGYQEKLTAGDNITIEGNVISATGGGSGGGSVAVDGITIGINSNGELYYILKDYFNKYDLGMYGLNLVSGADINTNVAGGCLVLGTRNSLNNSNAFISNFIMAGLNCGVANVQRGILIGSNDEMWNTNGILIGMSDYLSGSSTKALMGDYLSSTTATTNTALFGKYGTLQADQLFAVAYGSTRDDTPIFSIDTSGNVNANGTISGGGSDYAEYFEWLDGNPEGEDRVGLIVALRGDKIVLAQDGDDVLGIVSGTATVLGDNAEYTWSKIHLRDDFGRLIYEDVVFKNEDGTTYTEKHPKINPAYNPEEDYIARSKRKEWDVVGMLGKLYVRDDGTCGVGGYAKVGADGIATLSQEPTNMYVMKRTAANIVRVLFK